MQMKSKLFLYNQSVAYTCTAHLKVSEKTDITILFYNLENSYTEILNSLDSCYLKRHCGRVSKSSWKDSLFTSVGSLNSVISSDDLDYSRKSLSITLVILSGWREQEGPRRASSLWERLEAASFGVCTTSLQ